MTSRALLTFAVGPLFEEMLSIALPSFTEFADRHGYDLIHAEPEQFDRPPSWWKIPALIDALAAWDEVLWIDADCVIVDPSEDMNVAPEAWQAMVDHHTGDGQVPNCGVWLLRQPMLPYLLAAWNKRQYVTHYWWEQAAILDLMGYRVSLPAGPDRITTLGNATHFLDPGWNVHPEHRPVPDHARILHATCLPDRAAAMRSWTRQEVAA